MGIMVCREPQVHGPLIFGMETVRAFGSGYWFGPESKREGPWVAPLFTAAVLFYLGILTFMAGRKPPGRPSLLRNLITTYIVFTGVVELTRFVWDVSRFALVWAALHNLAEWGIIGFIAFKARGMDPDWKDATSHWWRSQLWILLVSQVILFAKTITEAGGFEQIAGLTCDWLLLGLWGYLYLRSDKHKRQYVLYGLIAAAGHMLEILSLVALLIGVMPIPWTFGCIVISFSTPITFWFYHRMIQALDESGDEDLVTSAAHDNGPGQDLSLPIPKFAGFVAIAALLSAATILGPVKLIPTCPPAKMEVSPGEILPRQAAAWSIAKDLSGTTSGIPIDGKVPTPSAPGGGSAGGSGSHCGATNETFCPSNTKLTGTTTIVAKPGMGVALRNLVATMPGPIRQEDGSMYYEEAWGGDNDTTIKFFESWSSIRSLYKHIYTSPSVARTFYTQAYRDLLVPGPAGQKLEGPFRAMIPCSEVQKEAQPVDIPMSTIIDAPMQCLWDRINAWSTDYSWVQHAQYITMPSERMPFLRVLHFNSTTVPVIRQTLPLPEPEQPDNGHRLIYYMLGGGFLDTIGEVYRGDLTLEPMDGDHNRTKFKYTATIVAKDPSQTDMYYETITSDFNSPTGRIQFLQKWGREVANSDKCKAMVPPVPTPPAPEHAPSTAPADYFYVLELPRDAPAMPDTGSVLRYLLSKQPATSGPAPEVLYAANVGRRNFPGAKVPGPDLKKAWSVTVVVRFPDGCTVPPAAVGEGVAVDTYRVEVRPKALPSEEDAAKCPPSHELDQAIADVKPEVDAMFKNFDKWYAALQANASDPTLPVKPNTPMSGINLLQFKSDEGVIGQPCYGRYLREAYELISHYGGGLYYFGEVVDEASESWDEIVIPLYNTGNVFFKVVFDTKYYDLLGLRDATLTDQANIDVAAIPGSVMLIP